MSGGVRAASSYPDSVSVQAAECFPSGEVRNGEVRVLPLCQSQPCFDN